MTRADQLIVQRGLAPSRSAAQRLIARGAVRWRTAATWRVPRKAGDELPEACELEVTDAAELRWASRGGLKLDGALDRTGIVVAGRLCLDVGQSSGGFTDVLLARGARHVVGVDVGHGQLAPRLRHDPRVTALEGLNARALAAEQLPFPRYDLIVGDLSFISLALVLPALAALAAGDLLMLVKPQFELTPADIGKGGLVKDASVRAAPQRPGRAGATPEDRAPSGIGSTVYARVERRIRDACDASGFTVRDWFESPIAGGDGNTEFFVWGTPR